MRGLALMAMIAALCLGATATAQTAVAPDAAATKPDKPGKPKRICRSSTPTGSRMPVSECHTQAEWESIAAQNASKAGDVQRQSELQLPR